jgi:hypothetical protein
MLRSLELKQTEWVRLVMIGLNSFILVAMKINLQISFMGHATQKLKAYNDQGLDEEEGDDL